MILGSFGRVFETEADEDLDFVARAAAPPTDY